MKAISSKTSLSSTTMTTTISRHELQLQLQQRQQQQQQSLPKRVNPLEISRSEPAVDAAMAPAAMLTTTTYVPIDSLNNNNSGSSNNNNHNSNRHSQHGVALQPLTTAGSVPQTHSLATLPSNTNTNTNNNMGGDANVMPTKAPKRRSLLNFKSFDFNIRSMYSGLRNGNKNSQSQSSSIGIGSTVGMGGGNANGSGTLADTPSSRTSALIVNRMPPYLKIDAVDAEESENLLLDYPQSPYSSRRNSSHDDNRSSSHLLHIERYESGTRSQSSTPSPFFLTPYAMAGMAGMGDSSANVRRSSTSDIASCKRSGASSASDSRRPSSSDQQLLRRARERRSGEARMGRSVSHAGLTRGGYRGGGGGSGRRTSMAF